MILHRKREGRRGFHKTYLSNLWVPAFAPILSSSSPLLSFFFEAGAPSPEPYLSNPLAAAAVQCSQELRTRQKPPGRLGHQIKPFMFIFIQRIHIHTIMRGGRELKTLLAFTPRFFFFFILSLQLDNDRTLLLLLRLSLVGTALTVLSMSSSSSSSSCSLPFQPWKSLTRRLCIHRSVPRSSGDPVSKKRGGGSR